MGNAFRLQPGPTLYGENKTPVSEDVLEVGLLVAFGLIAFSFILIIPGIRGLERLWATLRVSVALWVGAVILVSNFGYGWYTGKVNVQTQYKSFTDEEITAEVGLFIGLRGVNITLQGDPIDPDGSLAGEIIDYNERFWWANPWQQGRFGFGRFAQRINQEFRAAEFRGMPYPILWVAEYFTLDGEQIRWGRKFRQAGWYAHIFLWLSFAIYLLDILVFIFHIRYGAYLMSILGLIMVMACFSFGLIIYNEPKMVLPWNMANCDGATADCTLFLDPQFGWSWYLVLFTGIAVFALGLTLYIMDFFFPRLIAQVFHHSVVEDDEIFEDEETPAAKEGVTESYGVPSRTGRSGRTRRGISQYRKTQRKARGSSRRGPERLKDEIPLEEIPKKDESQAL